MKPWINLIIIIIIAGIVATFWFFYLSNNTGDNKENVEYLYNIKLSTNGTNQYTLYIPIPLEVRDNQITESEMIQEIKIINGNATFTVIETNKGKALNITFNGNIHLKSNGIKKWEKWKDENYDYNILSLQDISDKNDYYYHGHNDIPHWIWCTGISDNETIEISIEAYFGNIHDETKSNITGEISMNGWQIQYGSLEHVVE